MIWGKSPAMIDEIERTQIDLFYESYRLRNESVERRLLQSIERNGIHNPLQGIVSDTTHFILLDGFKRYRCAGKLGIDQLPVVGISTDHVTGVLNIIRQQNASVLSAMEQATFIHDLHTRHGLELREIALRVDRSISWVSKRVSLITHMSEEVRHTILSGAFPLRSYMYTLSPFTRVKRNQADVTSFIRATSGHHFSTRDIETLAKRFFGSSTPVKEQILNGDVGWTLRMLKDEKNPPRHKSPFEQLYSQLNSCRYHTERLINMWHIHYDAGNDECDQLLQALDRLIENHIRVQEIRKAL